MDFHDTDDHKSADEFWNLDRFLSEKKPAPPPAHHRNVALTDITLEPVHEEKPGAVSQPVPQQFSEHGSFKEDSTIRKEENDGDSLVKKIIVTKSGKTFHFYDEFRHNALKYSSYSGQPCEPIHFFSFLPQYVQFSTAQRSWYLWWRNLVRQETYPDTDYSYIVLYIYELINLSDTCDPKETLSKMMKIWKAYRDRYERLDMYIADWIADMCLVYGLEIPDLFSWIGTDRQWAARTELPELFYQHANPTQLAAFLMEQYSTLQYQKSSYYLDENADALRKNVYDDLFPRALGRILPLLFGYIRKQVSPVTVRHDSFTGALCVPEVKYTIEILLYPLHQIPLFRRVLTQTCRYIENHVRELLFIRAKLSVKDVPDDIKTAADAFFISAKQELQRNDDYLEMIRKNRHVPYSSGDGVDYDFRYTRTGSGMSAENARKIEQESWQTTEKLVESFETQIVPDEPDEPKEPAKVSAPSSPLCFTPDDETNQMPGNEDGNLRDQLQKNGLLTLLETLLKQGQDVFLRACTGQKMLPDTFIEHVNEISLECIGDVIVERNDNSICVVPDYVDEWSVERN